MEVQLRGPKVITSTTLGGVSSGAASPLRRVAVLNGEMGRHEGVGILVSEESRETNAAYTLRNPDEVALFLEKVVELGIEHQCSTSR